MRRAAKRGVIVRVAPFDDEFARGIHKICNEAPGRQGRRFWHYGKDFETVKTGARNVSGAERVYWRVLEG